MAKYVFPAVFTPEDGLFNVEFPDLPSCYTCGDDLTDAMAMADDALGGWLSRAEALGDVIPTPSALDTVSATAAGSVVTLILADTTAYRRAHSDRAVKKTLTIPSWLNEAAEARAVNFSQTLQEALCKQLGFER